MAVSGGVKKKAPKKGVNPFSKKAPAKGKDPDMAGEMSRCMKQKGMTHAKCQKMMGGKTMPMKGGM